MYLRIKNNGGEYIPNERCTNCINERSRDIKGLEAMDSAVTEINSNINMKGSSFC